MMCSFDKTKPMPKWMTTNHSNPATRRGQKYYLKLWMAQPPWANRNEINAIYREAKERRRNGENVQVDHIFPLQSKWICGLHVHTNLVIIPAERNRAKSNTSFPGHEQLDMFDHVEHFDLEMQ